MYGAFEGLQGAILGVIESCVTNPCFVSSGWAVLGGRGPVGAVGNIRHFGRIESRSISKGLGRSREGNEVGLREVLLVEEVGLHEGVEGRPKAQEEAVADEGIGEELTSGGSLGNQIANAKGKLEGGFLILLEEIIPSR